EQVLASIEAKSGSSGSASDSDERAVRARLLELREQLTAKRQRVEQLEEEARRHEAQRPTTKLYRLHSESHHMTYSEAEYERLWARQRTSPVRILTSGGLSWWWYADRFWWGDPGLRAQEISALVLELDQETGRQRDSTRRAVASAGGATPPAL